MSQHENMDTFLTNLLQSIAEKGQGELSVPQNMSVECMLEAGNINVNVEEGQDDKLRMTIAEMPGVQIEIENNNKVVRALFEKAENGTVNVDLKELSEMNMCLNEDSDGNMVLEMDQLPVDVLNDDVPENIPKKIQIGIQKKSSPLAQMIENGVMSCNNLSNLLSFLTEYEFATNETHPKFEQLQALDKKSLLFSTVNDKIKHVKREFLELRNLL